MPVIQSGGVLRVVERSPQQLSGSSPTSSAFSSRGFATYAAIYRTQPNVRTVVSFIARNVADLALHVYRRVSDTDRVRLVDHELALWMATPNPAMTRYRMVENLMNDMGIYFNAYWLKLRGETRLYFVRLPPEQVTVDGFLLPTAFNWTLPDGNVRTYAPSDIVHFAGYDPCDPLNGLSPIETLRGTLEAEANASAYHASYYRNASRVEGVISRPKDVPKWTPEQKQAFREQWQSRFAGPGNAGQTAVLEDGMTFTNTSYSPRDSEFTDARKLSREEVARSYHVPLPMVGILDHATFSNIREQHKNLYQDALGPWLTMLQEELERQVLPECHDQADIYTEFNIEQKLRGSFEEQAAALQTMVGRPVLTLNEGRGRLNLPAIKNDPSADRVAQPLNVSTTAGASRPPTTPVAVTAPVIRQTWRRQQARLAKLSPKDRPQAFDIARWDRELAQDLEPLLTAAGVSADAAARESTALATLVNADTLQLLVSGEDAFSPNREAALYVS